MGFNANGVKVEDTGLSVRYSVEQRTEQVTDKEGKTWGIKFYVVRRRITKRYAYVGLSLSGARALSDRKIAKYTKEHLNGDVKKLACQANIIISRGDAWYRVDIDVNEEDIAIAENSPSDPANLFPAINSADYDEDVKSALSIDSWRVSSFGISGRWSISMKDANPRLLMCQWKAHPEDAWTTVYRRPTFDSDVQNFSYSVSASKLPIYFRLAYGDIFSEVIYATR